MMYDDDLRTVHELIGLMCFVAASTSSAMVEGEAVRIAAELCDRYDLEPAELI